MMARCRWREDGGKEEEQDESLEHDDSEEHRWHARLSLEVKLVNDAYEGGSGLIMLVPVCLI